MKSPGQGSGIGRAKYDLTVPPVVCFGHGRIAEVGRVAAVLGKRIWLVVGNHSFLLARIYVLARLCALV